METRTVTDTRRVVGAAELRAQQRLARQRLAPPQDFRQRIVRLAVARPAVQLTARGAVLGLFVACFVTLLLADWTGWTALADLAFVAGGGAAAWYTKPGALLPLVVSPPVIFFCACACAELLTASGMFTTATGILITLGAASPWLFIGTALTLGVALSRGLPGEIADLVADLRSVIRL
jgi:hypothetical protein